MVDFTTWRSLIDGAGVIPDSGLSHRYDTRELSLSDGDTVDPFTDIEGSEDLAASGSPTYTADVINGNPVTREDGTDDKHQGSFSSSLSQPFAIFAAVNIRSVSTSDNEIYFWDTAQDFGPRIINNKGEWQIADTGGSANGGTIASGTHIVGGVFDGANTVLRVDGADETTHDTSDGLGGINLAHHPNGVYTPIDFGEILFYDTSPNISEVESYLSDEWGISI